MMENVDNFEYYILERDGSAPYPLVDEDPDCEITEDYLYENYRKKIENIEHTAKFEYGSPTSKGFVVGDYFSQPNSIVSQRIKDTLNPLNIYGIQFIPAEIETNTGDIIENFYYIHIYNWIEAVDRKKSKFKKLDDGNLLIDYFFLDEKILGSIPFEERLVFILEEDSALQIYHKSIVDAIMAVKPEGLKFTRVEDWRL